ncbi:MAG: winged helix-turn-helix domain-containing protein [Candidatus Dormibacteria bacterium]
MTYLEAALRVLGESGEALTVGEITERALAADLIRPTGKTPEAAMSAVLYVELTRHPHGRLRKRSEPGRLRSRRGTVRFQFVP